MNLLCFLITLDKPMTYFITVASRLENIFKNYSYLALERHLLVKSYRITCY